MIAQIKVLANAKEIESAQNEFQRVAQENQAIENSEEGVKQLPKQLPTIPEPIYGDSDILIDIADVKLAFVNSTGEISIKYHGDNFNLIYSDFVWAQLVSRFK